MPASSRLQTTVALFLLCISTLLAYRGVAANDFVYFDDIEYLFNNDHIYNGLSLSSVRWALTSYYEANWIPLTWLSHMVDMSLFGADPAYHHLVNLAFHLANTILLFHILTYLTGSVWKSAAVAALFALHPVNVESVAWVAERKNVLSTLFLLLTIRAYFTYRTAPSLCRYVVVFSLYLCGLAAKPMLVTLPFILLLLDWWQSRQPRTGFLSQDSKNTSSIFVNDKVPLIVAAVFIAIATIIFQHNDGAIKDSGWHSFVINTAHAVVNYTHYLLIIIWPSDLAVLYPYKSPLPIWQPAVAVFFLAAITVQTYRLRHTKPYLLFGWFWFMITLIPVAGFIRIGAHSIADRYAYVPQIGIFIAFVWSTAEILAPIRSKAFLAIIGAILMYGLLSGMTSHQVAHWKDSVTLFRHALDVTTDNWLAHNNIAVELIKRGDIPTAQKHIRESLRIKPDNADAYYNLGKIYSHLGETKLAIQAYQDATNLNPEHANAYGKLALLYLTQGNTALANAMHIKQEQMERKRPNHLKQDR